MKESNEKHYKYVMKFWDHTSKKYYIDCKTYNIVELATRVLFEDDHSRNFKYRKDLLEFLYSLDHDALLDAYSFRRRVGSKVLDEMTRIFSNDLTYVEYVTTLQGYSYYIDFINKLFDLIDLIPHIYEEDVDGYINSLIDIRRNWSMDITDKRIEVGKYVKGKGDIYHNDYIVITKGETNESKPVNCIIKRLPYPTGSIEYNMIGIIEEICSELVETENLLNTNPKDYTDVINFLIKDDVLYNAIKLVKKDD